MNSNADAVTEWREVMETARHFNDLLMRIRTLALPLIVAAAAGTVSLVGSVEQFDLPAVPFEWLLAGLIGTSVAGLMGLVPALASYSRLGDVARHRERGRPEPESRPHLVEWFVYVPVILAPAFIAVAVWSDRGVARYEAPVELVLVYLATLSVVTIYLLDRYYYFLLLVGAVQRAGDLEEHLGFKITGAITRGAPPTLARLIVTALYGVPVLFGLATTFVLLWATATCGGNPTLCG